MATTMIRTLLSGRAKSLAYQAYMNGDDLYDIIDGGVDITMSHEDLYQHILNKMVAKAIQG